MRDMRITIQCPDCHAYVNVTVAACAACGETDAGSFQVGKPGTLYAGRLLCPGCACSPDVALARPHAGPSERKRIKP